MTLDVATEFQSYWMSKVKAVAFADSVHGDQKFTFNQPLASWFAKNSVNWITSDKDVSMDSIMENGKGRVVIGGNLWRLGMIRWKGRNGEDRKRYGKSNKRRE